MTRPRRQSRRGPDGSRTAATTAVACPCPSTCATRSPSHRPRRLTRGRARMRLEQPHTAEHVHLVDHGGRVEGEPSGGHGDMDKTGTLTGGRARRSPRWSPTGGRRGRATARSSPRSSASPSIRSPRRWYATPRSRGAPPAQRERVRERPRARRGRRGGGSPGRRRQPPVDAAVGTSSWVELARRRKELAAGGRTRSSWPSTDEPPG